jgi:hypothetical protein
MKQLLFFPMLMAVTGVGRAGPDLIDTAEVRSATPILERVTESRQECDPVPATEPAPPAQQCRTVRIPREVVKGYTVIYRYGGRDITTTLPYDPGPTVRVGVSVVDAPSKPAPPTAGMLGSNVRDVTRPAPPAAPAPAPAPTQAPASDSGGFQYRY